MSRTLISAGGWKCNRYFFSTPTQIVMWNGEGARESFEAHLKAEAQKVVAQKVAP
jgi:hypothetical protein